MARAIVRWSISGERNNATGLQVRKVIEEAGFGRRRTGTWELDGPDMPDLLNVLGEAVGVMGSAPGGGVLDNLSIHVDDADNN